MREAHIAEMAFFLMRRFLVLLKAVDFVLVVGGASHGVPASAEAHALSVFEPDSELVQFFEFQPFHQISRELDSVFSV